MDTRCWRLQQHAVHTVNGGNCDGCMIGVVGGWVMVVFASTCTACTGTDLSVLYCTVQYSVLYNKRKTYKETAIVLGRATF